MADTPEKIRKEIEESSNKLSEEIISASEGLKPKFKNMIKNIAEVNGPLAKSVAELRNTSKDTFAGALQAQKLASLTSVVDKYLTEGQEALDPKELEILNKNFINAAESTFDIDALKEIGSKIEETSSALNDALDEEQSAIDKRNARLATAEQKQNVLGKMDKRISELKEKQMNSQGAVLEKITQQLQEEETKRAEKQTAILAGFDREIEEAKEKREALESTLNEEEQVRSEYNDQLTSSLQEATNFEGLEEFSGQLKELTGLDLVGGLDGATSKILAFAGIAKTLGKGLITAGLALKAVVMGTIVPAIAGFTASLLAGATAMIIGALPILAIAAVIGLAAFGIYKAGEYLYENSEGFRIFIDETWMKIKEFGIMIKTFFTNLYEDVLILVDELAAWWSEFDLMQSIKDIWNKVQDFAIQTFEDITAWFESAPDRLIGGIEDAIDSLMGGIEGAINYVRGLLPSWLGGTPDTPEEPKREKMDTSFDGLLEDSSSFDRSMTQGDDTFDRALEGDGSFDRALEGDGSFDRSLEDTSAFDRSLEDTSAFDKVSKDDGSFDKALKAGNDRFDNSLQRGLQPAEVEAGPRFDAALESDRGFDKLLMKDDGFENTLSGNKLSQANLAVENAKLDSQRKGDMAIQNVVGGTTVNNMNTTKIMGRPNVFDDDRTSSRLNQSGW